MVELLVVDEGGALHGLARSQGQDIVIPELRLSQDTSEQHLAWTQRVTKLLRLMLEFDVLVTQDTLHGTARAGRLPASSVTGTRAVTTS